MGAPRRDDGCLFRRFSTTPTPPPPRRMRASVWPGRGVTELVHAPRLCWLHTLLGNGLPSRRGAAHVPLLLPPRPPVNLWARPPTRTPHNRCLPAHNHTTLCVCVCWPGVVPVVPSPCPTHLPARPTRPSPHCTLFFFGDCPAPKIAFLWCGGSLYGAIPLQAPEETLPVTAVTGAH